MCLPYFAAAYSAPFSTECTNSAKCTAAAQSVVLINLIVVLPTLRSIGVEDCIMRKKAKRLAFVMLMVRIEQISSAASCWKSVKRLGSIDWTSRIIILHSSFTRLLKTVDIVLAILELLKYHQRVLYIDIDIHHGKWSSIFEFAVYKRLESILLFVWYANDRHSIHYYILDLHTQVMESKKRFTLLIEWWLSVSTSTVSFCTFFNWCRCQ